MLPAVNATWRAGRAGTSYSSSADSKAPPHGGPWVPSTWRAGALSPLLTPSGILRLAGQRQSSGGQGLLVYSSALPVSAGGALWAPKCGSARQCQASPLRRERRLGVACCHLSTADQESSALPGSASPARSVRSSPRPLLPAPHRLEAECPAGPAPSGSRPQHRRERGWGRG